MSQSLYDNPDLYDAVLPLGDDQRAHYQQLAAAAGGGGVLELACGSGSLVEALVEVAAPVVGLDLAPSMLAAARRRAPGAELVAGDMRTFDLGRTFALIVIARNSLLHLHDAADIVACFASVRRHLAPGGRFAFDVFNPDVRLLAKPTGERTRILAREGHTVDASFDYDAAAQVNRVTWFVSSPDGERTFPLHLRSIFPQELPLLLAAGGFTLERRDGDFAGAAFVSASPRQVCVCTAS